MKAAAEAEKKLLLLGNGKKKEDLKSEERDAVARVAGIDLPETPGMVATTAAASSPVQVLPEREGDDGGKTSTGT